MKKYDHYVRKANFFEWFNMRRKAIEIMKEGVTKEFSDLEKASGYIYIGFMYKKLGELSIATNYFNWALQLGEKENYPFSSNFKDIIEAFVENEELDKAVKWRNHLLTRASYDKKFVQLEKMNLSNNGKRKMC